MAGVDPRSRATTEQFGVVKLAKPGQTGAGLVVQANDPRIIAAAAKTLAQILSAAGITPFADGTYTVGLGITRDGTITIKSGIITNIVTAQP